MSKLSRFDRRIIFLQAFFAIVAGGALTRAYHLQVNRYENFSSLSETQYLSEIKVPAWRGDILDRNGKKLATTSMVPSVCANPREVKDPVMTAKKLSNLLGVDQHRLVQRLSSKKYFIWVQRQISPELAERVMKLGLPGVRLTDELKRFYPNDHVASHVLGFTNIDGEGLEGLERGYESRLQGKPLVVNAYRNGRGKKSLAESIDEREARGSNLHLTLDLNIQEVAENALAKAVAQFSAKSAVAVAIEVDSGDVLAMASYPSFDPSKAGQAKAAHRRNRAVTDSYEPGSTMKPFVLAAALSNKSIDEQFEVFGEKGRYRVGRHTIRDTSPKEWMNLTTVIAKSSNIGIAKIGELLGREDLYSTYRSLGFGERTNIGLSGEVAGILRPSKRWADIELATLSFGQGMTTNILQLASSYLALASDGEFRKPRLVRQIENSDGTVIDIPRNASRAVFKPDAVAAIRPMLQKAASPEGTGSAARISGFHVAGKTGTAQKVDPVMGGYSQELYVASFAGFLPVKNPRVVIAVAVDEPQEIHTGGKVAAPVFAEIAAAAMLQLGVAPDPSALHLTKSREQNQPSSTGLKRVTSALDRLKESIRPEGDLPSFKGLSLRQAVRKYAELGLSEELQIQGSGFVKKQIPKAGTKRGESTTLTLELRP